MEEKSAKTKYGSRHNDWNHPNTKNEQIVLEKRWSLLIEGESFGGTVSKSFIDWVCNRTSTWIWDAALISYGRRFCGQILFQ